MVCLFSAVSTQSSYPTRAFASPSGCMLPCPPSCVSCRWAATHVSCLGALRAAERELAAAHSACRACHSGGQLGAVVCANGECPVLYGRASAPRRLADARHRLERLELSW
jgi:hypothetical protein